MDVDQIKEKILKLSDEIIENESLLTELDREIGDGDHGTNMKKGFKNVREDMKGEYENPKEIFKKIAMTLISKVGGASGPLYGSFFLSFATALDDSEDLDTYFFKKAFSSGVQAVEKRGGAGLGDKTMLDVLIPVSQAIDEDKSHSEIVEIAKENMEKTKDIVAKKGRASYLGERSLGHIDPGAMSSYIMIRAVFGD